MLGRWMTSPVHQCCCRPGPPNQRGPGGFGEGELLEEKMPGGAGNSNVEVMVDNLRAAIGIRGHLPAGPRERMVPTYATADSEVLHGEPLLSGNILQLTLGESIHEMRLLIHVNGFSLTPVSANIHGHASSAPHSMSTAWSPFSLVEKCQVKTMQHSAYWAVFKLTVFRREGQDRCYYFATTGCNAYKERDRWVIEMVSAIGNVTTSLFPPHAITVEPLPGVSQTSTRIMAGYLLQSGSCDNVSLFYCELHAYSAGEARLAIYHDEWCEQEVNSIPLADNSTVSTRKGAYCTVFGVDHHRFCARTREEKDLWLRAVSNIKVKLMFDAPDPTDEELQIFRAAVHERIGELEYKREESGRDPLLSEVPRLPPMSPRGDYWDPDPMEDMVDVPGTTKWEEQDDGGSRHSHAATVSGRLGPEDCRKLLRTVVSSKMAETPGGSAADSAGTAAVAAATVAAAASATLPRIDSGTCATTAPAEQPKEQPADAKARADLFMVV